MKYDGFSGAANDWYLAKHDVYGTQLLESWNNFQYNEIDPDQMELIGKFYNMAMDVNNE